MHSTSPTGEHDYVCGSGFKRLTRVGEALNKLLNALPEKPPEVELVPTSQALGRVLARDMVSQVDAPPYDRAAMDGYAVVAEDTYGATNASPVLLKVAGTITVGTRPAVKVEKGQAVSIPTGGQMPHGANAVVMIEHARQLNEDAVEISKEAHPNENVSRVGEDVRRGEVVLKKGAFLLPQDIGMLTSLGVQAIVVARRLRIGVLSTGDELVESYGDEQNKIVDANRPALINMIRELGCEPVDLGIVGEDADQVRKRLLKGLETADIVLVSAGTSVGPSDDIPEIIGTLGKPGMLVHGVAMRPSMPTGLAVVNDKPVISLPGYPVSAYFAFVEFVRRPAIPGLTSAMDDDSPRPRNNLQHDNGQPRKNAARQGLRFSGRQRSKLGRP